MGVPGGSPKSASPSQCPALFRRANGWPASAAQDRGDAVDVETLARRPLHDRSPTYKRVRLIRRLQ